MRNKVLALLSLMLVALPGLALAHAHLDASIPGAGASVSVAPKEVTIDFTEALEGKYSKIKVQNVSGDSVDKGDSHLGPMNAKRLIVGLRPLAPGTYRVIWNVTSTDTHHTHGEFTFKVTG